MDSFNRFINSVLELLIAFGDVIFNVAAATEVWVREQLAVVGLYPAMQTLIMSGVAFALIIGSLRFLGGLLRIGVVMVLLLVAIHVALPVLPR